MSEPSYEQIERVARAIAKVLMEDPDGSLWRTMDEGSRNQYRHAARAALKL
jgi:hypothetical protein